MRTRILALLTTLAVLAVACGAPKSGGFTPIERDIPDVLTATTSTTTTTLPSTTTTIEPASTTTSIEPPPTTIANEFVRLFFIAGREQLFGIDVLLARGVSVAQVMEVLQAGPTGEAAAGLRTAIPSQSLISTSERRGEISVDLPPDFFTANEQNPIDQLLAVAQIVLTLTQLGGISQVTFTQDGEPIEVLLSDGSLSNVGQVLYEEDYEVLLSGNPPATTTTTTTTTTPTTTTVASTTVSLPVEEPTTLPATSVG